MLKLSPLTSLKCLDSVRAFFRFCIENAWVSENVMAKLQAP